MPSDTRESGEASTQPGADTSGTDQSRLDSGRHDAEPGPADDQPESLEQSYDLKGIISGLVGDLNGLRKGTITVQQARASAELARQVLRGLHFVVTAQRFLTGNAKQIGGPEPKETKSSGRGRKSGGVTIDA